MKTTAILVNAEECVGCRLCEIACSHRKSGAFRPTVSRLRVKSFTKEGVSIPLVCRKCDECGPLAACPEHAISRDEETRTLAVDHSLCVACGKCAVACPYSAVNYHPDDAKSMICDLCGGDPECVKYCFTGAIRFGESETATERPEDYVGATRAAVLGARAPGKKGVIA